MAAEVVRLPVPPVPLLAAALNCSTLRAASGSRHFGAPSCCSRRRYLVTPNEGGSWYSQPFREDRSRTTGRHDDTSGVAAAGDTLLAVMPRTRSDADRSPCALHARPYGWEGGTWRGGARHWTMEHHVIGRAWRAVVADHMPWLDV